MSGMTASSVSVLGLKDEEEEHNRHHHHKVTSANKFSPSDDSSLSNAEKTHSTNKTEINVDCGAATTEEKKEEEEITEKCPRSGAGIECGVGKPLASPSSSQKLEPIVPGDLIEYMTAHERTRREARIISVDPKPRPILQLDNGECLPNDVIVKRIKIMILGRYWDHDGVYRPIDCYDLRTKPALSVKDARGDFCDKNNNNNNNNNVSISGLTNSSPLVKVESPKLENRCRQPNLPQSNVNNGKPNDAVSLKVLPQSPPEPNRKRPRGIAATKKNNNNSIPTQNPTNVPEMPNHRRRTGRRSQALPHLTEQQLRLASDIKKFIFHQWTNRERSTTTTTTPKNNSAVDFIMDQEKRETIMIEALQFLEDTLDIPRYRMEKFLDGDSKRLIQVRIHKETEQALTKWLASPEKDTIFTDDHTNEQTLE